MNGDPTFPAHPRPMLAADMTLRDWFAGYLAAAELASCISPEAAADLACAAAINQQTIPERIAFNAFRVADALIAARAAGGES